MDIFMITNRYCHHAAIKTGTNFFFYHFIMFIFDREREKERDRV